MSWLLAQCTGACSVCVSCLVSCCDCGEQIRLDSKFQDLNKQYEGVQTKAEEDKIARTSLLKPSLRGPDH